MSFTTFFDKIFWLLVGAIPFLISLIYKMSNQLIKSEFKEEIKKLENKLALFEKILNEMENSLNSLKKHEKNNRQHSDELLKQILDKIK